MEVRLADCAGFCFGVKRAVDTVYEQLKNGKTIYTYGPIVHNEEVVRELAEKGVRVLESKEELKNLKAGETIPTVIIRAHGVAKEIYDIMEANGLECRKGKEYGMMTPWKVISLNFRAAITAIGRPAARVASAAKNA